MRERIDLNGEYLLLCAEHRKVRGWDVLPATLEALEKAEGTLLTGQVPGNFELDLYREGLIEDPFYGTNTWRLQKLEAEHVFYGRHFSYRSREGMEPVFVMEGVDTIAEVYLNGKKIADLDNMFLIHEIPAKGVREGVNELVVHILPACMEARKQQISAYNNALKYNYETLRLRKSVSMFGWDIMPRIVSAGIWRPVSLEYRPAEHIRQAYLMTVSVNIQNQSACLQLFYDTEIEGDDLSEYRIRVEGRHGDSRFRWEERLWFVAGKLDFTLEDADLWWPRGYGQPCMYDVEVTLLKGREPLDTMEFGFGIRTVGLERGKDRFEFLVNGKTLFLLGTNFVPIDAFHSRDRQRLPKVMELLWESGCNAVRIWGGGVYEDDYLYEQCDKMGILIWQDFMMACGIYPTDLSFCEVMRREAVKTVRRLRQHPSLLLWSGDNECDQSVKFGPYRKDPNRNHITRQVLRDVVDFEDPVRPYLPSSPYYDEESEQNPGPLPEDHLWGPRDYYKSQYYKQSSCRFASEIGYHGCVSRRAMERFLPPESMWPWQDNDAWLAHAANAEGGGKGSYSYRIGLMARQVEELFGQAPESLDEFILASQISQAEAKKFFIELFRLDPRRTGIIWWNLIDGWPQFSDAVVDYYFGKKLAFDYIRQVQQPLLLAMREPEDWKLELAVVNDTGKSQRIEARIRDCLEGNRIVWAGVLKADSGISSATRLDYSQGRKKFYVIEWDWEGGSGRNHYLAGNPPFDVGQYRAFLEAAYGKRFVDGDWAHIFSGTMKEGESG